MFLVNVILLQGSVRLYKILSGLEKKAAGSCSPLQSHVANFQTATISRSLYDSSSLFYDYFKGFYQNRLKKWSKDKLDLNIRSLIFAFEENKMKLKFNNPPCQQYRCVCQQWQKHLLKQVKIWTYVISFRDINKRGCIQTEYSVRHEDRVLQN